MLPLVVPSSQISQLSPEFKNNLQIVPSMQVSNDQNIVLAPTQQELQVPPAAIHGLQSLLGPIIPQVPYHQLGLAYKDKTNLPKLINPFSAFKNTEIMLIHRENERVKEQLDKINFTKKEIPITEKVPFFRPSRKGVIQKLLHPLDDSNIGDNQVQNKKRVFKLTEANIEGKKSKSTNGPNRRKLKGNISFQNEEEMDKENIKRVNKTFVEDEKEGNLHMSEYINNIRRMRYADFSIIQKKEEIVKMEEFVKNKDDKLKDNIRKFESDKKFFQDYVAKIKQKEENTSKKSDEIIKQSKEIQNQISNIQTEISNITNIIENKTETLKKMKANQQFIFSLQPESVINEFKEKRIEKLRNKGIENETIFANIIPNLNIMPISPNSPSSNVAKQGTEEIKKDSPFKDIHELGITEVDSDDEFPIFFKDPHEVIELINQREEQNISQVNIFQENESNLERIKSNFQEQIKILKEKKLLVQENLKDLKNTLKEKTDSYEQQQNLMHEKNPEKKDDIMSTLAENPEYLYKEINDIYQLVNYNKFNQNLTSSPIDQLKDIEDKVDTLVKIRELREFNESKALKTEEINLMKKRKEENVKKRKDEESKKRVDAKKKIEYRIKKERLRKTGIDNIFRSVPKVTKLRVEEKKEENTEEMELKRLGLIGN